MKPYIKLHLVLFVIVINSSVSFAGGIEQKLRTSRNIVNNNFIKLSFYHSIQTKAKGDVENSKGYNSLWPDFGLALGNKLSKNLAFEISGESRKFKYSDKYSLLGSSFEDSQYLSIKRIMVSTYYNFNDISKYFMPYVTVGFGIAYLKPKKFINVEVNQSLTNYFDYKSTSNFSFRGGAGIEVPISNAANIDLGVLYNKYGQIKSEDTAAGNIKLKSTDFLIGIKYSF